MNEEQMHLLLDRWWGIWFDWCRRQTQQRSEPCGNRSWEACAILSDWCGLRCQERSRIKLEGAKAHIVIWCMVRNPTETEVSKLAACDFSTTDTAFAQRPYSLPLRLRNEMKNNRQGHRKIHTEFKKVSASFFGEMLGVNQVASKHLISEKCDCTFLYSFTSPIIKKHDLARQ